MVRDELSANSSQLSENPSANGGSGETIGTGNLPLPPDAQGEGGWGDRGQSSHAPLLTVENLTTVIHARKRALKAVENVSFSVGRGEILGLVGESGCGKSMTALSIMRLLPQAASVASGTIRFGDRDLTGFVYHAGTKAKNRAHQTLRH